MSRSWNFAVSALMVAALAVGVSALQAAEPEEAHYNVVITLYNAGQWQAALNKITEREKLDLSPAMRAKYLYVRGLSYERGGKTAQARTAYEQLSTKYPNSPQANSARLSLLYLDYAGGNFDAVVSGYGKIDAGQLGAADRRNAALMYAESLYAKKDDKAALAAYQNALQQGVDAAPLAGKLFDLYVRLGMHAQVVSHSGKGIPGLPADAVALARAEAQLALSQWNEVDVEAKKVPANSKLYPRAAFARAQALLRQNKLKDALAPLEAAIAGLKDPPAPPAAHLALAECLLEAGRTADVSKALAGAEKAAQSLSEADRRKLQSQIALLRLRATVPSGSRRALIQSISESRAALPRDQLPKILYMRLFALSEEKDPKAVVETMKDDLPIFQTADELGPATLIYMAALRELKKPEEAAKLLEDLLRRKPAAVEALTGRLLMANEALSRGDFPAAGTYFEAVAAVPGAAQRLGKKTFDELQYNRAVVMQKAGQPDQAAAVLRTLIAAKPGADIQQQALSLLGQICATRGDFTGAAAAWKQALPGAKPAEEVDLRDRLARVLFAAKDYAGALEQLRLAAKGKGPTALPKESREVWARSLYLTGKFAESAAVSQGLAEAYPDASTYAYETAVAFEKAGQHADAEKWYAAAARARAQLPAEYASAVDAQLAALRLKTGAGDMGAAHWLAQVVQPKDERAFDAALTALRKITAAGKLDAQTRAALESAWKLLPADSARRYALGALLLEALHTAGETTASAKLSSELSAQFAENEKKLDPKSTGATIAPAIIHFYRGEALRRERNWGEALAAYETILGAYPYNEWPDAAACSAAECYLALGDRETALKKFQEVAQSNGNNPATARWREVARRRLGELAKEKGK